MSKVLAGTARNVSKEVGLESGKEIILGVELTYEGRGGRGGTGQWVKGA